MLEQKVVQFFAEKAQWCQNKFFLGAPQKSPPEGLTRQARPGIKIVQISDFGHVIYVD